MNFGQQIKIKIIGKYKYLKQKEAIYIFPLSFSRFLGVN